MYFLNVLWYSVAGILCSIFVTDVANVSAHGSSSKRSLIAVEKPEVARRQVWRIRRMVDLGKTFWLKKVMDVWMDMGSGVVMQQQNVAHTLWWSLALNFLNHWTQAIIDIYLVIGGNTTLNIGVWFFSPPHPRTVALCFLDFTVKYPALVACDNVVESKSA